MKKFIVLLSLGLSIGFAIALANAEDTPHVGPNDLRQSHPARMNGTDEEIRN